MSRTTRWIPYWSGDTPQKREQEIDYWRKWNKSEEEIKYYENRDRWLNGYDGKKGSVGYPFSGAPKGYDSYMNTERPNESHKFKKLTSRMMRRRKHKQIEEQVSEFLSEDLEQ